MKSSFSPDERRTQSDPSHSKTALQKLIMKSNLPVLRVTRAAFTLMEMMLVLAIIALLIAIGAVTLGEVDENAKFTAAEAQISTLGTAITQYKTMNRTLPPTLDALINPPGNARKRKLVKEEAIMDPWNNKYLYRSPGKNGASYEIYSAGPDKKEGTEDDVVSR